MRLSKLQERRKAQKTQTAFEELRKAVIQSVPYEHRREILAMLDCRKEIELAKLGGLPPSLRQ